MDLVIDSNRLFAAFIKDSACRRIIFDKKFNFHAPKEIIDETAKYFDLLIEKSKLKKDVLVIIFSEILNHINLVSLDNYINSKQKALEIMENIDKKDAPFVALALSIHADGIWSDDKHFDEQDEIHVFKTKDLLDLL